MEERGMIFGCFLFWVDFLLARSFARIEPNGGEGNDIFGCYSF
jgi:hypothetical protein